MSPSRHYAGVLVAAEPARLGEVVVALAALDGSSVGRLDPATGRCVAVLESADRTGQERLFRAVLALPGVRGADLVYHLIDAENEPEPGLESEP